MFCVCVDWSLGRNGWFGLYGVSLFMFGLVGIEWFGVRILYTWGVGGCSRIRNSIVGFRGIFTIFGVRV